MSTKSIKSVFDSISKYNIENNSLYYGRKLLKYFGNNNINFLELKAEEISECSFNNCSIGKITFSEGLVKISDNAFSNCNIKEMFFPSSLAYCDFNKQGTGKTIVVYDHTVNSSLSKSIKLNNEITLKTKKEYEEYRLNESNDKKEKQKQLRVELKNKYKKIFNYDLVLTNNVPIEVSIMDAEKEIFQNFIHKCFNKALLSDECQEMLYQLENLEFNKDIRTNKLKEYLNETIKANNVTEKLYNESIKLFKNKEFTKAYNNFITIKYYKDSSNYIEKCIIFVIEEIKIDLREVTSQNEIEKYIDFLKQLKNPKAEGLIKECEYVISQLKQLTSYELHIKGISKDGYNHIQILVYEHFSNKYLYNKINKLLIIAKERKYRIIINECDKLIRLTRKVLAKESNISDRTETFILRLECIKAIAEFTKDYSIYDDLASTIDDNSTYEYSDLDIVSKKIEYFYLINEHHNVEDKIKKYEGIKKSIIKERRKQVFKKVLLISSIILVFIAIAVAIILFALS